MRAASLRPWFSIAALVLSVLAAAISFFDSDSVELAFFALTSLVALTQAFCLREPDVDWMRRTAMGIALAWVAGAIWIGVLLLGFQGDGPPPPPEERYLGLTATVYHLAAVYGGAALVTIAAFGPKRWLDR